MEIESKSVAPSVAQSKPISMPKAEEMVSKAQVDSSLPSKEPGSDLSRPGNQRLTEADKESFNAVNRKLDNLGVGVMFAFDEQANTQVVKLIDKTTEEVVKQFPSEEALKMLKNIQNYLESSAQRSVVDNKSLTGALFSEII
jgi:flagellar protein FlaG